MEKTLVLIKPDGVQRGYVGEIISRLEKKGLQLVAAKFILAPKHLAEQHYAVHYGKPFYEGLIAFITSSPIMAMVWRGPEAISVVRSLMGATNPSQANPGTIRFDLAMVVNRNLTHASDGPETAAQEIALWFSPDELYE
ncbi:MAG: nucleoside-diphosphate kinase [Anaerolineae bacterium]|nr:nucleoside-diphosphate kinase [Anaerolineae bacterium]